MVKNLFRHKSLLVAALLVLLGLGGAVNKLIQGEHALGTTDVVPWGVLIAGYVFFAAAGTGVGLIASSGHAFGVKGLESLGTRGLFLALSLLIPGFALIGIELGNPFHMFHVFLSPNFSSGIWWMSSLYSAYMALLVIECYLTQKQGHSPRMLSIVAYLTKTAAVANLGGIFGLLAVRSFWHGFYFPIYMIVTAIASGAAVLAILLWFLQKSGRLTQPAEGLMAGMSKILLLSLGATAVMVGAKLMLSLGSAVYGVREAALAYISGPLAWRFWGLEVIAGIMIPFILLLAAKGRSVQVVSASGLALAGMFAMRADFVTAGQIIPLKVVEGVTGILYHSYRASITEWVMIAGAFGAAVLLYTISENMFKMDDSTQGKMPSGNKFMAG